MPTAQCRSDGKGVKLRRIVRTDARGVYTATLLDGRAARCSFALGG
jgi:hypothetical protein